MNKLTPQNAEQEHMIQILLAKMQGIDIEYFQNEKWHNSSSGWLDLRFNYRIKSHELPITREMWAMIDEEWKWVAKDEEGWIYFYTDEPYISSSKYCWNVYEGDWSKSILAINADDIDWRKSLTRRPEGV
ncbi:hypothetical protein FcAc13_05135 [Frischella sp. Ac13]|uniref:Uncharacterized protein n=1 Tax=Frischella japonica TaxID=2741544 RepID=A0ABR7QWV1_9GAMM|nr:hypothetical protein [Frischella japonica]MBC9130691.1 hypothetical protein [Frischella japonica]